ILLCSRLALLCYG
nr:immunoglobulin heavy chain junction region [Mus musculus]